MQVFVKVVEKGSFTAAAEEMRISTTMVTAHIRALEEHLGVRLLERTTRRQSLTEIGAAYLESCRDVLSTVDTAEQAARSLQAEPRGKLRVTAPVSYGTHKLMPAVAAYMARYPQVQVELILNNRVVDLVEEGFEVAIRSGELDGANLVARTLRSSRLYAAASPAYLARHARPSHPSELPQHNCLGFSAWGKNPQWSFRRGDETVQVPVCGSLVSNNGQALLQAALDGVGIVVQADVLLDAALAAGQLQRLLPDWELPTRAIYIVRTRDLRPTAKVRSFVDFMLEKLG